MLLDIFWKFIENFPSLCNPSLNSEQHTWKKKDRRIYFKSNLETDAGKCTELTTSYFDYLCYVLNRLWSIFSILERHIYVLLCQNWSNGIIFAKALCLKYGDPFLGTPNAPNELSVQIETQFCCCAVSPLESRNTLSFFGTTHSDAESLHSYQVQAVLTDNLLGWFEE